MDNEVPIGGPPRKALPARTIEVPEGYVLTNAEIASILSQLNAAKMTGQEPVYEFGQEPPEWYLVKIPVGAAIEKAEVIDALTKLNRAKEYGNADVLFTFDGGRMVKRGWIQLKDEPRGGIQLGGPRMPKEF